MNQNSESHDDAAIGLLKLFLSRSRSLTSISESHYPENIPPQAATYVPYSTMTEVLAINKQRQATRRKLAESSSPTSSNPDPLSMPTESSNLSSHTSPITPASDSSSTGIPYSTEKKSEHSFTDEDAALALLIMKGVSIFAESEVKSESEYQASKGILTRSEQQRKFWNRNPNNEINIANMRKTNFVLNRTWYPITDKMITIMSDSSDETEYEHDCM